MNCLDTRRHLVAAPRERTKAQEAHLANCEDCARFAGELAALDRKINKALRLPVPEGLPARIALTRVYPKRSLYAIGAAAALLITASAGVLTMGVFDANEPTLAAEVVGPTHPAVAAIAMVLDQEPTLLKERRSLAPGMLEERLKPLGLSLKESGLSARYVGKCEIAGRECEHIVLVTPEGFVSVLLMAHERPSSRVLVVDRRMAALLSPAPTGAYIVVADSPKAVRRARKLFVNG